MDELWCPASVSPCVGSKIGGGILINRANHGSGKDLVGVLGQYETGEGVSNMFSESNEPSQFVIGSRRKMRLIFTETHNLAEMKLQEHADVLCHPGEDIQGDVVLKGCR